MMTILEAMTVFIKNMVCDRCIMVVKNQVEATGIPYRKISLGELELDQEPAPGKLQELKEALLKLGFEVLDDKKSAVVNQIKSAIIKLIHSDNNELQKKKISVILSEQIGKDYHSLSTLFSSVEGITIEKFIILQRIERAKELLMYDELSLNQIADTLGYSSVQHLSQQFKKVTGLKASDFKQQKKNQRKPLDHLN